MVETGQRRREELTETEQRGPVIFDKELRFSCQAGQSQESGHSL